MPTGSYRPIDFSPLRGLAGITDEQIEVHLELYHGYVKRTNVILETLQELAYDGAQEEPQFAELNRRLGWEFDGMRLHEYYFEGLHPEGRGRPEDDDHFVELVERQFGGLEAFKTDLTAVARMPGVGWAITYLDPVQDRLANFWIEQHDAGHPAGCVPILVLDVWEHAFSAYLKPTERARYLEDFYANVDWQAIARRVQAAAGAGARARRGA